MVAFRLEADRHRSQRISGALSRLTPLVASATFRARLISARAMPLSHLTSAEKAFAIDCNPKQKSSAPSMEVEIIAYPDLPSAGVGEVSPGPTAGAIANGGRHCFWRARSRTPAHARTPDEGSVRGRASTLAPQLLDQPIHRRMFLWTRQQLPSSRAGL
jgi:hypothetical protein